MIWANPNSGFLLSFQLCFLLLIHGLIFVFSGPMLVPPYYVTESPRDDWDDRTTEAYSVRSSRNSSPTLSVNDPSEQGAAV